MVIFRYLIVKDVRVTFHSEGRNIVYQAFVGLLRHLRGVSTNKRYMDLCDIHNCVGISVIIGVNFNF